MQKLRAGRFSASEIRGGPPGMQNSLEVLTGGSDDGRPRPRTDARAVVGLSCQSQKWNCGPLGFCEDLAYVAVSLDACSPIRNGFGCRSCLL